MLRIKQLFEILTVEDVSIDTKTKYREDISDWVISPN